MQFQLFIFYETHLFAENVFTDDYYPSGNFRWTGTLGWYSGPPRMNTIASRDQFKPIRIGENLEMNYN